MKVITLTIVVAILIGCNKGQQQEGQAEAANQPNAKDAEKKRLIAALAANEVELCAELRREIARLKSSTLDLTAKQLDLDLDTEFDRIDRTVDAAAERKKRYDAATLNSQKLMQEALSEASTHLPETATSTDLESSLGFEKQQNASKASFVKFLGKNQRTVDEIRGGRKP